MALVVRGAIESQLGQSLEAELVAAGGHYDWMQEFAAGAAGAAATLTPSVIGFAAVLDNLSAILEGRQRPLAVSAAVLGSLLLTTFLAGGAIDRLARNRSTGAHGFFSAAGAHFPRLLRLAAISVLFYSVIFGAYYEWLFDDLTPRLTRNLAAERSIAAVQLLAYLAFLAPVALLNIWFDYARVRTVVEDRRSMLAAVNAALGFIGRHFRLVAGVYLLNLGLLLAVFLLYALLAPGAGGAGASM